jgi:ATP-dependent Clp protease protease subunit
MSGSTFKITNEKNGVVDLKIDGEIGYKADWWDVENEPDRVLTAKDLKEQLQAITEIKATRIRVYINSLGGLVNHALNMYDALVSHGAEITTIIEGGYTASAATIIFMAGSERKISENALFLIHKSLVSPWDYSFNQNDLESMLGDVKATDKRIKAIYQRNGVDMYSIDLLMDSNNGNGKWIDADEVVEHGFATESIGAKFLLTAHYKTRLDKQRLPKVPNNKITNDMAQEKGIFGKLFGNMTESQAERELNALRSNFDNLENETVEMKAEIMDLKKAAAVELTNSENKAKVEIAELKESLKIANEKVIELENAKLETATGNEATLTNSKATESGLRATVTAKEATELELRTKISDSVTTELELRATVTAKEAAELELRKTQTENEKEITNLNTKVTDLTASLEAAKAATDKANGHQSGNDANGNDPDVMDTPKTKGKNDDAYDNNVGFFS